MATPLGAMFVGLFMAYLAFEARPIWRRVGFSLDEQSRLQFIEAGSRPHGPTQQELLLRYTGPSIAARGAERRPVSRRSSRRSSAPRPTCSRTYRCSFRPPPSTRCARSQRLWRPPPNSRHTSAAVLSWAPEIAWAGSRSDRGIDGLRLSSRRRRPPVDRNQHQRRRAFLNALLARAQRACCAEMEIPPCAAIPSRTRRSACSRTNGMRQRGTGTPQRIAIIDDNPPEQYLYPEFVLARQRLRGTRGRRGHRRRRSP